MTVTHATKAFENVSNGEKSISACRLRREFQLAKRGNDEHYVDKYCTMKWAATFLTLSKNTHPSRSQTQIWKCRLWIFVRMNCRRSNLIASQGIKLLLVLHRKMQKFTSRHDSSGAITKQNVNEMPKCSMQANGIFKHFLRIAVERLECLLAK